MALGGDEIILSTIIVGIGLVGNLKLFINRAGKNEQLKWNMSIYGLAILIVICGLLTPPDIVSNILFSVPLGVIYLFVLRKFRFSKRQKEMAGEQKSKS